MYVLCTWCVVYMIVNTIVYTNVVYDQVVYKSLLTQSSYNPLQSYNFRIQSIHNRCQMTRYDEATPHNHIAFYDHVVRLRYTIMLYDHVIRSCYMLCSCAFRLRFQRLRVGNRVVLDGGARVACMLGPPSWPTISTSSSSSGAFVPVVGGGMYGLR